MPQRALRLILTVLLTASILFTFTAAAFSEEPDEESMADTMDFQEEEEETTVTVPESSAQTGSVPSLPVSTTVEPTYSTAEYPVLTVSAISNYFGRVDAEYNEFTREITVTYMLKSARRLLSTDWTLHYDAELLTVDPKKNNPKTICPLMDKECAMEIDPEEGLIRYVANDLGMFDFSVGDTPYAKIVFDLVALTPQDSEITKIDLTVNDLIISEPNPRSGESLHEKEIILVANGKIMKSNDTKANQLSRYTVMTPSSYNEKLIRRATPDQLAQTTVETSVAPTVTLRPSTEATKPAGESREAKDEPLIKTGSWGIALLILLILLVCSTVLFILRKRDIYNN